MAQRERIAYLIAAVDGEDVVRSGLGKALLATGFQATSRGYLKRTPRRRDEPELGDEEELG